MSIVQPIVRQIVKPISKAFSIVVGGGDPYYLLLETGVDKLLLESGGDALLLE